MDPASSLLKIDTADAFPLKPHTLVHTYTFANWTIEELLGSNSHTNIGNVTLALDQKHILNVLMKLQKNETKQSYQALGLLLPYFQFQVSNGILPRSDMILASTLQGREEKATH